MSSKVKEKPSQINMQPEDANQNQDPKDKSPNLSSSICLILLILNYREKDEYLKIEVELDPSRHF